MAAQEETHFFFVNSFVRIEKITTGKYNFYFQKDNEDVEMLISSLYSNSLIMDRNGENDKENIYEVKAISMQTLNQYISKKKGLLSYTDTLRLMIHIGMQNIHFSKGGYVLPYINIDNIIVINDEKFILMDADLLEVKKDTIQIISPYEKMFLMSDELLKVTSIPQKIHQNAWIYSLGLLGMYTLTGIKEFRGKDKNYFTQLIDNIQSSKLYFMILRCVEKKELERRFLYI